ncbi:MAG TPA: DUF4390 domain-containing protein [Thermoanaerobaculia bacterium]|nr:DUF4390 domain-containing protein [Thermoanaerobaculia bacterium]
MRSAIVVLWLLAFAAGAAADDPRILGLHIALEGERVLASFSLQDAFDRRLESRLESGLPTSILYRLELHRDRKRWYDRRLQENTLEVVAVYDAVARTYTVHYKLDDKLVESRTVRERQEVQDAMTRIGPLPVFSLERVRERGRILVKVRAELGSRTFLSFIPVTIATDWTDSNKLRIPGGS